MGGSPLRGLQWGNAAKRINAVALRTGLAATPRASRFQRSSCSSNVCAPFAGLRALASECAVEAVESKPCRDCGWPGAEWCF